VGLYSFSNCPKKMGTTRHDKGRKNVGGGGGLRMGKMKSVHREYYVGIELDGFCIGRGIKKKIGWERTEKRKKKRGDTEKYRPLRKTT